jgi:hypothetical protein
VPAVPLLECTTGRPPTAALRPLNSIQSPGPTELDSRAPAFDPRPSPHCPVAGKDAIAAVYDHAPLNDTLIRRLDPDADASLAYEHAEEIGYPISNPVDP